jgi:hypothetical protein
MGLTDFSSIPLLFPIGEVGADINVVVPTYLDKYRPNMLYLS